MEALMRGLAWTTIAIAMIPFSILPATAQTYDPAFPVCIQTYGRDGGYISCEYTSMAVCQASASGRAAQCLTNPYYAAAPIRRRSRGY